MVNSYEIAVFRFIIKLRANKGVKGATVSQLMDYIQPG